MFTATINEQYLKFAAAAPGPVNICGGVFYWSVGSGPHIALRGCRWSDGRSLSANQHSGKSESFSLFDVASLGDLMGRCDADPRRRAGRARTALKLSLAERMRASC